jgi:peptidoglycan L-alanyl-D-glutamate endopeptidase CwlK
MPKLDAVSIARLTGVDPDTVRVVVRAAELTAQPFKVLEGVRSKARQIQLYGQGRTQAELKAKGVDPVYAKPEMPKVTWTLNSNHFVRADGYGYAVDLVPYPVDWNTPSKFDAIAKAMFAAGAELGVEIRWGADWDQDGKPRERGESDSPHFERVKKINGA